MYTEAQRKADLKYKSTLKQVNIKIKPEAYARIEQYAELSGSSVRAFILTAIDEKMKQIDESSGSFNCR